MWQLIHTFQWPMHAAIVAYVAKKTSAPSGTTRNSAAIVEPSSFLYSRESRFAKSDRCREKSAGVRSHRAETQVKTTKVVANTAPILPFIQPDIVSLAPTSPMRAH